MSVLKRSLFVACGLVLLVACSQPTVAWHGHPPFGVMGPAWSYGYTGGYYSHFGPPYTTSIYRSGWAGYADYGLATTTRIHYRPLHRPFWGLGCHARYAYRSLYSFPAYYYPTYHYVPTYPVYAPAACDFDPLISSPVYNDAYGYPMSSVTPVYPETAVSNVVTASDTSRSSQLVPVDYARATAPDSGIPEELLTAADAIFQAGGYREAATAYAKLNVQFGSSDQIFGRRFVAQVACGDLEQAAVIVDSAEVAGFQLRRHDLPGGQLAGIFAAYADEIGMLTEQLAANASSTVGQQSAMKTLGTWLHLAGDDQRSHLFLAMAEQLSGDGIDVLTAPLAKAEYVSLE